MKRRALLGGMAAAAGLGLLGCRPEAPSGATGALALRMVCDPWAGYYPAALAEVDGDFAREGLTVSMERSTSTDRMLAEFFAGRFDLMCASLGDMIPIAARIEAALRLPAGEASLAGIRLHTLDDNRRLLTGTPPGLAPVLQRYAEFHARRGEAPGDLGALFEDAVLP